MNEIAQKPCIFIASSADDLRAFPDAVRQDIGFALYEAQNGLRHLSAKPLKGFGGSGVLEVVENHDSDTYRAVYTVRFAGVVYVLHAFQKKSRKGIATARHDIDLIKRRLKVAEENYAIRQFKDKG
ncbi:MAG: type II toxin-antitoxin system RelE/ParE family toxin [Anderseniella sp.]|jgi:phage-related protein|nr:type II toxin-antitoxin system RelE/ParE family toxin [Anderseniella sp.]